MQEKYMKNYNQPTIQFKTGCQEDYYERELYDKKSMERNTRKTVLCGSIQQW